MHLGPIWPSRLTLGGVPLGDCWRHPAIKTDDATDGLVPLHKLSQWLTYSLIEPLQRAGIEVTDIDGLTGSPNIAMAGCSSTSACCACATPRTQRGRTTVDSDAGRRMARAHRRAARPACATWCAHGSSATRESLPLASVLEGGTWAAGRAVAARRRADGSPPIKVISDGTVF